MFRVRMEQVLVKQCIQCGKELPIDQFYKWKYGKDGYRKECKECCKNNNRTYYNNHSEKIIQNVREYTLSNKEKVSQYQKEYRINHHKEAHQRYVRMKEMKRSRLDSLKTNCVKCGEDRSYVIDFHHVDPKTKEFTIIDKYRSRGDAELENEIKKCVCLCANCHREFHWKYGITPTNPVEALSEYLGSSVAVGTNATNAS